MRGDVITWLRAHVEHTDDKCLHWPFSRMANGYGNLRYETRYILAHRLMCTLAHGDPPSEDHQAAHTCGQGRSACVNPRHLRWATQSENETDKIAHGTSNRGEQNGRVVHDEEKVLAIVAMRKRGMFLKDISARIGVPVTTISAICNGHNWSWLTGIPDSRRKEAA